ncbi:MAG: hypothetical protein LBI18_04805, partial [Planctomycetaceae bacterium]|nr:hypothetical protein [Planctomycetaceae bacterium]
RNLYYWLLESDCSDCSVFTKWHGRNNTLILFLVIRPSIPKTTIKEPVLISFSATANKYQNQSLHHL